MRMIDLTEEHERLYFVCLEDWCEEMKEAGDHKETWYRKMKDRGLRVKLALDDQGQVGGMIHYVPIEESFAEGRDLYFVNCIWVHGYRKGRGNFQKRGMGKALLRAAEADAKELGAKGLVAWGVTLPFFMKASWFRKYSWRLHTGPTTTAMALAVGAEGYGARVRGAAGTPMPADGSGSRAGPCAAWTASTRLAGLSRP